MTSFVLRSLRDEHICLKGFRGTMKTAKKAGKGETKKSSAKRSTERHNQKLIIGNWNKIIWMRRYLIR